MRAERSPAEATAARVRYGGARFRDADRRQRSRRRPSPRPMQSQNRFLRMSASTSRPFNHPGSDSSPNPECGPQIDNARKVLQARHEFRPLPPFTEGSFFGAARQALPQENRSPYL